MAGEVLALLWDYKWLALILASACLFVIGMVVYLIYYIHMGCPDNTATLVQHCIPNHSGGLTCTPEWHRVSGCLPR